MARIRSAIAKLCVLMIGITQVTIMPVFAEEHDHNYLETSRENPTCTQEGIVEHECSECGGTYSEVLEKTEHEYEKEVIKPTYEENGYTKYTCKICEDAYIEDEVPNKEVPSVTNLKKEISKNKIKLTWEQITGLSYEIQLKENDTYVTKKTTNNNTATLSNLKSGTNYVFRIRAVTGNNKSGWVKSSAVTTLDVPTLKATPKAEAVKLKWSKVTGATGYRIWQKSETDKKYKLAKKVNAKTNSVKLSKLVGDKKYQYKVEAVKKINDKATYYKKSGVVKVTVKPKTYLYQVIATSTLLWKGNKSYAGSAYYGDYLTGYYSFKQKGKVCLNYKNGTVVVPYNNVKKVNAKILSGSITNQCFGEIYGGASCGPVALWTLLKYEAGYKGSKDDVIRFAESHAIKGMGNLRDPYLAGSGCYSYSLVELSNKITKGKYKLQNVYSTKKKPSSTIKEQISNGKRCIISCSYAGWAHKVLPYNNGSTHFITIIGYQKTKNATWFYYVDPLDADSVHRISAGTLNNSIKNMPKSEPRCVLCRK